MAAALLLAVAGGSAAAAGTTLAPTEAHVGNQVVVSGTGWALTHSYTLTVTDVEEDVVGTWTGTTDGAGAFTQAGSFTPVREGVYTVTVNDGTTTIVGTVHVSAG